VTGPGVAPVNTQFPHLTVAQALAKPELVNGTRIAAAGVDRALRQLREQAGITEQDIIRVPALFSKIDLPDDYPVGT